MDIKISEKEGSDGDIRQLNGMLWNDKARKNIKIHMYKSIVKSIPITVLNCGR